MDQAQNSNENNVTGHTRWDEKAHSSVLTTLFYHVWPKLNENEKARIMMELTGKGHTFSRAALHEYPTRLPAAIVRLHPSHDDRYSQSLLPLPLPLLRPD
ncbi:hypothetical protein TruAng_000400 [Truncatella angustata]|nr:hypothetical protein TruAng_000400 [Truncatella angustata]